MMKFIVIGRPDCKWCHSVLALLETGGHEYEYFEAAKSSQGEPAASMARLLGGMGLTTVPQVWHGSEHIGGYKETDAYLKKIGPAG